MGPYVYYSISASSYLFTIELIHISCVSPPSSKPKHFHPFPPFNSSSHSLNPSFSLHPIQEKHHLTWRVEMNLQCSSEWSMNPTNYRSPGETSQGWKLLISRSCCFLAKVFVEQNTHSLKPPYCCKPSCSMWHERKADSNPNLKSKAVGSEDFRKSSH